MRQRGIPRLIDRRRRAGASRLPGRSVPGWTRYQGRAWRTGGLEQLTQDKRKEQ